MKLSLQLEETIAMLLMYGSACITTYWIVWTSTCIVLQKQTKQCQKHKHKLMNKTPYLFQPTEILFVHKGKLKHWYKHIPQLEKQILNF